MNIDEIKNLIEADGGKFIIVENGKPILAAMKFDDYKKILEKPKSHNPGNPGTAQENQELPEDLKNEPLKIEDLPV